MLIGICGGIGTGKSVVCRVLRVKGFSVYDCDSEAKSLMVNNADVRNSIVEILGPEAYTSDGELNRNFVGNAIFQDSELRAKVNAVVHSAVAKDVERFKQSHQSGLCFVESAILHSSGLDKLCDQIWKVVAPEQVRIERVMKRSGLTPFQITQRIKSQETEERLAERASVIENSPSAPLLPQIDRLLTQIKETK